MTIFRELYCIMNKRQKLKSFEIIVLQIIGSILELLGVTMILPFVSAIMDLNTIKENTIIFSILKLIGLEGEGEIILFIGVLLVLVYLFKNIVLTAIAHVTCAFSTNTQKDICMNLMKSYMSRDYIFFTKTNTAELIRGVTSDANSVMAALNISFKLIADTLTVAVIIVYLFYMDFFFAMTMGALVLLCIVIFLQVFKKKISAAGKAHVQYNSESLKYANQAFNGIKEILVKQKDKYFINKYEIVRGQLANSVYKHDFLEKIPTYLYESICVIGLIGVIYTKIFLGEDMHEFIPLLAVFAVAMFRILPLTSKISTEMNSLLFYKKALDITYENVKELDENLGEKREVEKSQTTFSFTDEIKVSEVCWKYSEGSVNVLENISLTIKKGDSVALIGPSGAGKTTLSDIILGLLKPQKGDVLVDGKSIYTNINGWSSIIQYVPQAVYLTDDSIRRNIAFGIEDEAIDDRAIWNALKLAQMENYVRELPEGLDTMIGERGIRLSGGQRQRIAIARALYDNPEVIVFDEATSSLDSDTESAIMEAIDSLRGIKTLIIVAHRLSTIRNCNHVFEIDQKKIREVSGRCDYHEGYIKS